MVELPLCKRVVEGSSPFPSSTYMKGFPTNGFIVKLIFFKGVCRDPLFDAMTENVWFVYIVRCADDKLYTGVSNDIKKRLEAHNSGKGCKFTSCRYPVKLLFWEKCGTRSDALKREAKIKKFPRSKKLKLVDL